VDRVSTGIEEFDRMIGGGFMRGDAVMVAGSAGTGKTTLALQYLVNGVTRYGENGIYVSFEQLPDQIYRDARNFGWDLRKLEEQNRLRVVCTSPNLLLEGNAGSLLEDVIEEIHPRRIVIDSMSHLAMYLDEKDMRKEAYRIIMWLKTRGLSSILIWESPQILGQELSITEVGLSFLVDCIVLLRQIEVESSIRHVIVVLKMRGSNHEKNLREYWISDSGVRVGSQLLGYEDILTGTARRLHPMAERFGEWLKGQSIQFSVRKAEKLVDSVSAIEGVRYCAVRDVLGNVIAGGQKKGIKEIESEIERLDSSYRVSLITGSLASMPASFGKARVLSFQFERLNLFIFPLGQGAILFITVKAGAEAIKEKVLRILRST
jgi:circadian clock protein KaiC